MKKLFLLLVLLAFGVGYYFKNKSSPPSAPQTQEEISAEEQSSPQETSDEAVNEIYQYQLDYLDTFKDSPPEFVHTYPVPSYEPTSEELAILEKQAELQYRQDMIRDLNDDQELELTQEDKEIISQMFQDEGLKSIHDDL